MKAAFRLPLRVLLALATLLVCAAAAYAVRDVKQDLSSPRTLESTAYVGSASCQRCHTQHYASWHRTYHRTMTQDASATSVLGQFDGSTLDYLGVRARMHRDAQGRFLIDWTARGGEARWQAEVVRAVGSHRYQQYLARDGDVLFRLPIAWDVTRARFIHMNAAFLTPDPMLATSEATVTRADYDRHVTRWNDNCVFCHNVHPNPGRARDSDTFTTEVAELGVACEACHGPGAEHVARNSDPLRRYALHLGASASDPTIRNPAKLPAARSAEVCGRCHGQRISAHVEAFYEHGDPFIPGQSLARYSQPLARDTRQNGEAGHFAARFWNDGTARLTAYEYQGYLQSPCTKGGALTCESCHAMHASEPAGQLRTAARADGGNAACTSCHRELAVSATLAAHTRHTPSSAGARCINCHMPQIVYGLVSVHLSHRIEVPDPARQARDERPDACTLCHADRSRSWAITASRSASSAITATPAAADDSELPELTQRLWAGDPIERAVAAQALGSSTAHYAPSYRPRLLGLLADAFLHDDYPAVRDIALRSLADALSRLQPSAAGVAVCSATARADERATCLAQHTASLPAVLLSMPDAALTQTWRSKAAQNAIEIGE